MHTASHLHFTSTVFPLLRSSALVSMHHERYQVSRFISFASFSYFSNVRLSTMFVRYIICPPMVDFPGGKYWDFEKTKHRFYNCTCIYVANKDHINVLLVGCLGCLGHWLLLHPWWLFESCRMGKCLKRARSPKTLNYSGGNPQQLQVTILQSRLFFFAVRNLTEVELNTICDTFLTSTGKTKGE